MPKTNSPSRKVKKKMFDTWLAFKEQLLNGKCAVCFGPSARYVCQTSLSKVHLSLTSDQINCLFKKNRHVRFVQKV